MSDCQRCGLPVEEGMDALCWDCDWDLANGGDPNEEAWEILMDRAENNYAFDPLWYPKPEWLDLPATPPAKETTATG